MSNAETPNPETPNPETSQAKVEWLQQQTVLGTLSEPLLAAIADRIQVEFVPENRRLVLEDTEPQAVYILKTGDRKSVV